MKAVNRYPGKLIYRKKYKAVRARRFRPGAIVLAFPLKRTGPEKAPTGRPFGIAW